MLKSPKQILCQKNKYSSNQINYRQPNNANMESPHSGIIDRKTFNNK